MVSKHAKHETDAKVVHLELESHRIARTKLAKMPPVVKSVHEKGKHLVLDLLKSFFDRADDSLFELADKAESNQEQNLYFDSMREVRVQRRSIERRFNDEIDQSFAAITSPGGDAHAASQNHFSPDALSLVDNDELEEMVALDTTIARANKEFGESIQLISLRLDSLVPVKVYQKNNPIGPDILCATFMAEARKLDVGIKAKLVLFKLFDKTVVVRLGELYAQINDIFKDNNVLPSLSSNQNTSRSHRNSEQMNARALDLPLGELGNAQVADSNNINPEVLSTLKDILGDKVVSNPAVDLQTQVAANDLINLLSRVQHMPSVMDSQMALNVRSILNQIQQQSGEQARIGQVDDQVMKLVGLLFDFILDDRNLAQPMKALISRMQIPIIKVAVSDKSFFTKSNHVARRLLNEMSTAAIGWQGDQDSFRTDPLYKKIDSVIKRLVEEFETDLSIFSELMEDFSAFLEKEKRRADVLERRTIDAEDGKAKAEVARTTVALEIELRIEGKRLPKVVSHLIKNAWSNVLFVSALKYGYESQEWTDYLAVLDDLVWSVQSPGTPERRQKLIKLVPSLLKRLRAGLDTISYNPFEMSDLFKSLEKVHIACIRGKLTDRQPESSVPAAATTPSPVPPAPQKPKAQPEKAQVDRVIQKPTAPATKVEIKPAKRTLDASPVVGEPSVNLQRPESAPQASESLPKQSTEASAKKRSLVPPSTPAAEVETVNTKVVETAKIERVVSERPIIAPALTEEASLEPYLSQVQAFGQGSWFDMVDETGESVRSRLAAFIKPTGKYIFVNRNGMKVAEKTQHELAVALRDDKLRTLDNSMLFDRALETVVSSLRKP